jgi:hypothetical protein
MKQDSLTASHEFSIVGSGCLHVHIRLVGCFATFIFDRQRAQLCFFDHFH